MTAQVFYVKHLLYAAAIYHLCKLYKCFMLAVENST